MTETPEIRLKRLTMRSMRRGTKEMDLLLMRFAKARLAKLDAVTLDLYEALLTEADQDLYQWISGQCDAPSQYAALIAEILAVSGSNIAK